jgi:hypothetical protein
LTSSQVAHYSRHLRVPRKPGTDGESFPGA